MGKLLMRIWMPCVALAAMVLAVHLIACPREWPVVVGGMAAGLLALVAVGRPSLCGDIERARRLALRDENADGATGMQPAERGHPSAAWVPILLALLMVATVAATAVSILAGGAGRERPARLPVAAGRGQHER